MKEGGEDAATSNRQEVVAVAGSTHGPRWEEEMEAGVGRGEEEEVADVERGGQKEVEEDEGKRASLSAGKWDQAALFKAGAVNEEEKKKKSFPAYTPPFSSVSCSRHTVSTLVIAFALHKLP